jgi:hypothetical protein
MSESQPIGLAASGPPETALPSEDPEFLAALRSALEMGDGDRRPAIGEVEARWPRLSLGWAALGDTASTTIDAYAAYRVGYHRGLDLLRGSGWRGSGYVRWMHEGNRGFLRCLDGLGRTAGLIGERDEQERCALFLVQLDPSWPPPEMADG